MAKMGKKAKRIEELERALLKIQSMNPGAPKFGPRKAIERAQEIARVALGMPPKLKFPKVRLAFEHLVQPAPILHPDQQQAVDRISRNKAFSVSVPIPTKDLDQRILSTLKSKTQVVDEALLTKNKKPFATGGIIKSPAPCNCPGCREVFRG